MFRIVDDARGIDMTAKFELGQEVIVICYQGYRKGVITGISGQTNDKGTIIMYNVELYVNRKAAPKIKKCLEKHIFSDVKDALSALAEQANTIEEHEDEKTE